MVLFAGCGNHSEHNLSPGQSDTESAQGKALADLEALVPPVGSDPGMHGILVNALKRQLAALPPERFAANVPLTDDNAVKDLRIWDNGDSTAQCRFSYTLQGDYDQDSAVTISDITPIAIFFNAVAGESDWTKASLPDGDGNGAVTLSDLTPIAIGFSNVVDGYILQLSDTGDGDWQDVATIPFAISEIPPTGGRRQFSFNFPAPELSSFYRVVPFFQSSRGVSGIPIQYEALSAPTFSISGVCMDGSGSPLPDVSITLDDHPPVLSGAGGDFEFLNIPDGYTGLLTPTAPNTVFLPHSWIVQLNKAGISDLSISGFDYSHLETTLPPTQIAGEYVTFEIHLHNTQDNSLTGFNKQATISVSPITAIVELQPNFIDGLATASVRFTEDGEYSLSITGLAPTIDGEIANITIAPRLAPTIDIEKWQGGAEGALSLVFDDGTSDHWSKGMQLWEDYDFRVTLGILANRFLDEPSRLPQLQEAFDAGHELANHTTTHPDLTTLTDAELDIELSTCTQLIVDNVVGMDNVYSLVYPYEMYNTTVMDELSNRGFLFARSGHQDDSDSATPNDAYDPPLLHLYSWANLNMLPMWMWDSIPDIAISSGDWMIEQCHGIGAEGEPGVGWSPRPLSDFHEHYDHIASKGNSLWVAPMAEVGLYILERNVASIELLSYTSEHIEFNISDGLDNDIYNVPLTVTMDHPLGWDNITVRQGSTLLTVSEPFPGDLRFDVTPGKGPVSVENGG